MLVAGPTILTELQDKVQAVMVLKCEVQIDYPWAVQPVQQHALRFDVSCVFILQYQILIYHLQGILCSI